MSYSASPLPGPPAPRRRGWPMYAGIGCGCLLALALLAAVIVVVVLVLDREGDDRSGPTAPTPSAGTESTGEPTEEATSALPTTQEPTTEETSEGGVSAQDEEDAKAQFLVFVRALGRGDHDAACGVMLDPFTREPFAGARIRDCEEILAASTDADSTEDFKNLGELLTPEGIDTEVQGDGSIRLTVYGTEFPSPMVRASDGLWYVDFGS
ncbi:hypothetical protein [Brachybacterium phenoliresistens]|uniref:hypothetical protein n=1 Tax=Brachybacterium phenoliresistens TaxID=396014 RepID=UPI0031CEFEEA